MECLAGWNDLDFWALAARGDEVLGSALRPYGFHAGNMSAILAYPYILFNAFREYKGMEPCFTYKIWLNDIEPISFARMNPEDETSRVYPTGTFQFTPAPNNFPGSLTDYWQPVIEGVVRGVIEPEFPEVKLEFHRTSELIGTEEFTKAVFCAIQKKSKIVDLFRFYTNERPIGLYDFVWPLCPTNKTPAQSVRLADVATSLDKLVIGTQEKPEACQFYGHPEKGDWAMHVRLLQATRLAMTQPDLWFIGMDHYPVSSTRFLEDLGHTLAQKPFSTKMMHTPMLIADGYVKLSKSRGNAIYMDPHTLIEALDGPGGFGLYTRNAPGSRDILALGEKYLPAHVKKKLEPRLRALDLRQELYIMKDGPYRFEHDVELYGQGKPKVDLSTGCPHVPVF